MEQLDKTFIPHRVLTASEMNEIVGKINEIIQNTALKADVETNAEDITALKTRAGDAEDAIASLALTLSGMGRLVVRDSKSQFPSTGDGGALYLSRSNATLYYWGEAGVYVPIEGGGGGGDIPWERIVTGVSVEYPDSGQPDRLCVVAGYGDEEGTETYSPIPLASSSGAGLMSVAQNAMLGKLEEKVFPLSLSLSLSPSPGLLERGEDTVEDAVLSWRAYIDGGEVVPDSAEVREYCPDLGTDTKTETTEREYTVAVLAATTTLTVRCLYGNRSATAAMTVTFVYPTYIFFSTDPEYYKGSLVALENKQALSTDITYDNIGVTNDKGGDAYLYIVSPYTPSEVKSVAGLTIGIAGKVVSGTGTDKVWWRSDDPLAQGEWRVSTR